MPFPSWTNSEILSVSMLSSVVLWTICAVAAFGMAWSRYDKKKTRTKLLQELAQMDGPRREKILSRLRPEVQMELRQELMQRFGPR